MILIIKITDLIENSVFLFNAIYIRGSTKRNMCHGVFWNPRASG